MGQGGLCGDGIFRLHYYALHTPYTRADQPEEYPRALYKIESVQVSGRTKSHFKDQERKRKTETEAGSRAHEKEVIIEYGKDRRARKRKRLEQRHQSEGQDLFFSSWIPSPFLLASELSSPPKYRKLSRAVRQNSWIPHLSAFLPCKLRGPWS